MESISATEEIRSRGRPIGSVQTFTSVLEKELFNTMAINRRIRSAITRTLNRVETLGNKKKDDLEAQLAITKSMETLASSQAKVLESLAKHMSAMELFMRGGKKVEGTPKTSAAELLDALEKENT
jgi:hypothetical protein